MDVYRQYVAKETGEPSKVKKKKKKRVVCIVNPIINFLQMCQEQESTAPHSL